MINNLLALRQAFLRFLGVRALLCMIILSSLVVLTLLAAVFLMLITWHWHPVTIFWVCLVPWILAVIIIAIITQYYACQVKKRKRALLQFAKNSLISEIAGLALNLFLKKRSVNPK